MSAFGTPPACPKCGLENTYPDGVQMVCADCGHEWVPGDGVDDEESTVVVRDANGTPLMDGDSVVLIKDLKVKGSSQVLKVGTKVKNIRIVEGDHDVEGKIDGSAMMLKSQFLKKA